MMGIVRRDEQSDIFRGIDGRKRVSRGRGREDDAEYALSFDESRHLSIGSAGHLHEVRLDDALILFPQGKVPKPRQRLSYPFALFLFGDSHKGKRIRTLQKFRDPGYTPEA